MAEFKEVMKQKERMCEYANVSCDNRCDLHKLKNLGYKACNNYIYNSPDIAEEIIMNWANEHPVKTNADKFREVFGFNVAPHSCHNSDDCNGDCDNCRLDSFWSKEYKELY